MAARASRRRRTNRCRGRRHRGTRASGARRGPKGPAVGRARAWAGVVAPVAFVTSWTVAGALRDGYDPAHDAISRLAELGAPNRWIVTAGITLFGAGAMWFAPRLRSPAAAALAIAGASSIAVAAFPCTAGCPGAGTTTDSAHAVAAGIQYVSFVLVPVLHDRDPRGWSVGVAAATVLALHAAGIGPNGALQRAGLTILDAWLAATAVAELRRRAPARSRPR